MRYADEKTDGGRAHRTIDRQQSSGAPSSVASSEGEEAQKDPGRQNQGGRSPSETVAGSGPSYRLNAMRPMARFPAPSLRDAANRFALHVASIATPVIIVAVIFAIARHRIDWFSCGLAAAGGYWMGRP